MGVSSEQAPGGGPCAQLLYARHSFACLTWQRHLGAPVTVGARSRQAGSTAAFCSDICPFTTAPEARYHGATSNIHACLTRVLVSVITLPKNLER